MIKKLKKIFKQTRKEFMCCVDTNFIEGTVLKNIEKDTWNIKIKDNPRLEQLNKCNCLLFINDINVYEVKSKLLHGFNIPMERLDEIYNSAMKPFINIKLIRIGEIKINPPLVNWMLKYRLDLKDGLLINSAQRLELPFVTSERKAEQWKKAYQGILSQSDFWNEIRKISNEQK